MIRKLAIAVVSLFLANAANATTWYVSTSGNDASSGSLSAPLRTITRAASKALAGDEVVVRGGTYAGTVSIASKGTSLARIAFHPYSGETVVIDGSGTATDTNLVTLSSAAYVDFTGFEVRNATRIGILVWGANNVKVSGNTVHDSVRNGIYAGASALGVSSNITIDGNRVYHNVLENQNHSMAGGWSTGISVTKTDKGQITNNRVDHNQGEGIGTVMSSNLLIQRNEVSDNFSVNIYLDNTRYTKVNRNLAYSTGDTTYFRDGYAATGIGTANETVSNPMPLTDLTITNNIVVNAKWGFYYLAYEAGGGLKNTTVSNNTFYKASYAVIEIANDAHQNSFVENNIFYQAGGMYNGKVAGAGVTYRNNNWYGGSAGAAAGSGDILTNPYLANAGGLTAADYKLTAGSPDVEGGIDVLSLVSTDYFGAARTSGIDVGAHEYSLTAVASDTQAPTAPGSLHASSVSASSVALAWSASTDNVGISSYKVYRNNGLVATVSGTSWTDAATAASTTYSYQVYAYDAAGNPSAGSNLLSVTTPAATTADTQKPSAPASLTVNSVTSSSVSLGWLASTDNVGVTGYRVYRNNALVATVTGTTFTVSGLAASTTYSFYVVAIDAAGNASAASNTVSATTLRKKRRA